MIVFLANLFCNKGFKEKSILILHAGAKSALLRRIFIKWMTLSAPVCDLGHLSQRERQEGGADGEVCALAPPLGELGRRKQ